MTSTLLEPRPAASLRIQLAQTGLGILMLICAFVVFAMESGTAAESPDWLQLFLGLFGGLSLFLAGLQLLSEGMKKAAGQTLKIVLGELTTNRVKGALTGAFVTAVLNSSTVTTLLGFLSNLFANSPAIRAARTPPEPAPITNKAPEPKGTTEPVAPPPPPAPEPIPLDAN